MLTILAEENMLTNLNNVFHGFVFIHIMKVLHKLKLKPNIFIFIEI
jgi:hypothetical protein